MDVLIKFLIGIIAVEHLYFLWLEMFAWTTKGPRIFPHQPKNTFQSSKVLAANQGLYNGFLAIGLIWSLFIKDNLWEGRIALFFLGCIFLAGIYGALTVERKILFVQAIPALLACLLILFG